MPFDATPVKTNTVADVLRRAKALIDAPEKWFQGSIAPVKNDSFDTDTAMCIGYAIISSSEECGRRRESFGCPDTPVMAIFKRANNIYSVPIWNDDECRTHAEVMAAFDKAIELAERD